MLSRPTTIWRAVTSRRFCHVNGRCVASRSLHSKSELERTGKPMEPSEKKERKHRQPFMAPRQMTIETKHPELTTKSDVLNSLKTFRMSAGHWIGFSKRGRQAVVILGTPSFASWLDDDETFIRKILETITRPSAKSSLPPVIEVICACVDGLSPPFGRIHYQRGKPATEGFSLLHGTRNDILPDLSRRLWSPNDASKTELSALQSTITFSRSNRTTTVTVPLANTLFQTGRQSTLLIAKWKVKNGSLVKMDSEQRSDIAINAFGRLESGIPSNSIPAVPLTPARRIISGLGNIVRQLDFGDEGIGPASRELEKSVYEYLELKGRSNSTVSVWALIAPEDTQAGGTSTRMERLLVDAGSVKRLWRRQHSRTDYVGHLIGKGATFCRVLSGGGGWGTKNGLLSLDPQTSYIEAGEALFDFSNGSLEEQQVSALGNIAKPGAYIQFFAADSSRIDHAERLPEPAKKHLNVVDTFQNSLVIGTVPSTIDNVPRNQINRGQEASGIRKSFIKAQLGHFGCVSESGVFLNLAEVEHNRYEDRIDHIRRENSTKIDLPYSYFYRSTWNRAHREQIPTRVEEGGQLALDFPMNRQESQALGSEKRKV